MLKSFWEGLVSPYSSFWERVFFGLLLVAIPTSIVAIVAITVGFYLAVYDGAFLAPSGNALVSVEDKETRGGSTRLIYINKVPIYQRDPDKYFFHFKIEEQEVSIKVSKDTYEETRVGDMVTVTFGYGRVTGDIYPIDLVK